MTGIESGTGNVTGIGKGIETGIGIGTGMIGIERTAGGIIGTTDETTADALARVNAETVTGLLPLRLALPASRRMLLQLLRHRPLLKMKS